MPSTQGAGFSDNTRLKAEQLTALFDMHMTIAKGVMGRHQWTIPAYLYLDLNAGPGLYRSLEGICYGSPLLAVHEAARKGLPLLAYCVERHAPTFQRLTQALAGFGLWLAPESTGQTIVYHRQEDPHAIVTCSLGDYQRLVPQVLPSLVEQQAHSGQKFLGMVFSDENGAGVPFALLGKVARELPRLEVLIHCSATSLKRLRGRQARQGVPRQVLLEEGLQSIPRPYWHIRDNHGAWQWTFLLGTSWEKHPELRSQKMDKKFYRLASPEGQSILARVGTAPHRKDNHERRRSLPEQGDLFSP